MLVCGSALTGISPVGWRRIMPAELGSSSLATQLD
jgi:hypothetical protein